MVNSRRHVVTTFSSFHLLYRTCLSVCLSYLSVTLVNCGQTVEWIKMSLGMEGGLGPGPRHTSIPSDILIHPTVWPQFVLNGDTAAPRKRAQHSPIFGPVSGVAKLSPISATVELLSVHRMASLIALLYCSLSHLG